MIEFNPATYGPALAALLDVDRDRDLGSGSPDVSARDRLEPLTPEAAFGHTTIVDTEMARACLAGVWLLYDFLDESHTISQAIETTTGSYWHAVMHRREPDYSNSKYWFRRVGDHEVFEPLGRAAVEIAQAADVDRQAAFLTTQQTWDPFAFVDLCQAVARGQSASESLCRTIARLEWKLLFDFSYRRAVGA